MATLMQSMEEEEIPLIFHRARLIVWFASEGLVAALNHLGHHGMAFFEQQPLPSTHTHMSVQILRLILLLVMPAFLFGFKLEAQHVGELGSASVLREHYPEVLETLRRLDQAHGVLLYELAIEGGIVRSSGTDLPTFGFEFDMIDRMTSVVQGGGEPEDVEIAEAGLDALGSRAAAVVRWGRAFQREVISILADHSVIRRSAHLEEAVALYHSRPSAALTSAPKNMDILYDHAFALDFRTGYADLDGFVWAGHWFRLAATEPFTDIDPGVERQEGIDTVTNRYFSKLTYGEPPEFFPSEIPLAPAIAPGLIWLSPQAAMIWDNLSMYLEVLADVLASPDVPDVQGAIEAITDFFMDPELAVTDQDEWEIMALRHGIFFQGGYPLSVMTQSELNVDGHAAHFSSGGGPGLTIPGMPRGR